MIGKRQRSVRWSRQRSVTAPSSGDAESRTFIALVITLRNGGAMTFVAVPANELRLKSGGPKKPDDCDGDKSIEAHRFPHLRLLKRTILCVMSLRMPGSSPGGARGFVSGTGRAKNSYDPALERAQSVSDEIAELSADSTTAARALNPCSHALG